MGRVDKRQVAMVGAMTQVPMEQDIIRVAAAAGDMTRQAAANNGMAVRTAVAPERAANRQQLQSTCRALPHLLPVASR